MDPPEDCGGAGAATANGSTSKRRLENQSEGVLDGRNPSRGGMDASSHAQLAESFHWKLR